MEVAKCNIRNQREYGLLAYMEMNRHAVNLGNSHTLSHNHAFLSHLVGVDPAIVTYNCIGVIVPVHWHGQSISDEDACKQDWAEQSSGYLDMQLQTVRTQHQQMCNAHQFALVQSFVCNHVGQGMDAFQELPGNIA